MGSNNGANKGSHYSHSEKFWSSKYDKIKMALADDKVAFNKFNSEVKDLESFKVCWIMSGGSLDRITQAFRYLASTEKTTAEPEKIIIKTENTKETKDDRKEREWRSQNEFYIVDPDTGEATPISREEYFRNGL